MITYGDLAPLTIQATVYGFYAYNDNEYDGAPDSEFPANVYGHGMTPDEAAASYWERRYE